MQYCTLTPLIFSIYSIDSLIILIPLMLMLFSFNYLFSSFMLYLYFDAIMLWIPSLFDMLIVLLSSIFWDSYSFNTHTHSFLLSIFWDSYSFNTHTHSFFILDLFKLLLCWYSHSSNTLILLIHSSIDNPNHFDTLYSFLYNQSYITLIVYPLFLFTLILLMQSFFCYTSFFLKCINPLIP